MAWIEKILLLFLYVGCTQTKLISLSPGWEAFSSYQAPYSLSNGEFFFLLTSNRTSITSSNSTFALGLFSSDSSRTVTLIICLLPFNSSLAIDVWNVGIPMINNDPVLRVSNDKSELQLLDENHNIVWSTPGDVSALELTESGNLIVYNSSQGIIWQSFDHPTDTFLPGQIMRQGMQFRASNSSYSSYSAADYSIVVESSGLVLYSNSGGLHLPYGAVTIDGTYDYNNAMQKCGSNGTLKVTYNVTYDADRAVDYVVLQGCNKSSKYPFVFKPSFKFRFLRLDSDGNVRHYLWKEGTLIVNIEMFGQKSRCELPNICGPYGVCSEEGQCSCPSQNSSSLAPLRFTSDSKAKGCKPTTALSCDARSMRNKIFLTVSNVTYFSNRYVVPLYLTEKECVSSCLSTCSCLVAFYENSANLSARACYHISTHVCSLQRISSDSQKQYLAYIKVQPSSYKKRSSISQMLIIVISIAAATSFLILASMVGFIKWLYSRGEDDFLILMPGVPHKFTHKELEDATNGFQHKLGEGGFGAVFSGKLKDGRSIAVKRLEGARVQGQREFEAEVKTLGGIDHINLVRLYGFCIEGANRLLVYEWMPNGSLDKWLFVDDSEKVLPWASRMAIAMDTAQGLAYLHQGCSQPVLHLDIKPQSILLGEDFKAKVSDLGMAKLINQDVSTMTVNRSSSNLNHNSTTMITQVRGTPGYLAPELLTNCTVSKKCDIYSYGIVLLEIISGKKVYGCCDTWFLPYWAFTKVASGNIMQIVDPRIDGDFEHNKAEQIIRLACWCIHENPEQRPSMPQIIQMLQGKTEAHVPDFIEPQTIMNLNRNVNSSSTVISESISQGSKSIFSSTG